MANKQTTAVEWLEEQIVKFHEWKLNPTFDKNCFDEIELNKAIKQALAMEREQIETAYIVGIIHPLEMEASKQAKEYYNDTYGK